MPPGSLKHTPLIVLLVVLLAPLGAVARQDTATPAATPSADWTTFFGDAARRGVADAGPVGEPVELWRVQAGGPCNLAPAVAGGVVYAACGDGVLYALDAATGAERWRFSPDTLSLADGPTVAGDLVYVVDRGGTLFSIDVAMGQERWRFDSPVGGSPVVDDGLLAIGTPDGALLGIDAATGDERWRYQVTDRGTVNNSALGDGVVYAGTEAGTFVAVDAATGELRWQADTGPDSTGTARLIDGVAYIGASGHGGNHPLSAYDAESGELLWRRDEPIFSPSVADGIAYSGSVAGTVYALDAADGHDLWRVQFGGPTRAAIPASGIIYVAVHTVPGAVVALDAATSEEVWTFELEGGFDGGLAVAGGAAYVTTGFGSIYAIGGSGDEGSPAPTAASPAAEVAPATDSQATFSGPIELVWQSPGGVEPIEFPIAVALDPEGTLWVVEGSQDRFHLFAPDGAYLEAWGESGQGDGQFNFFADGQNLGDLAFAPDGSFYVPDVGNYRIQKFDQDRNFLLAWGGFGQGDGQFAFPHAVEVDGQGRVYVADGARSDIQVFDADGRFQYKFGSQGAGDGQFLCLPGFSVDDTGTLYVPDCRANRVQTFSPDGKFLLGWGRPGSGPGEFADPVGAAADAAGNVYVFDVGNLRTQVFDAEGRYLTEFAAFAPVLDNAGYAYGGNPPAGLVMKFRLQPPLAP